jgi:hypothetical protein
LTATGHSPHFLLPKIVASVRKLFRENFTTLVLEHCFADPQLVSDHLPTTDPRWVKASLTWPGKASRGRPRVKDAGVQIENPMRFQAARKNLNY